MDGGPAAAERLPAISMLILRRKSGESVVILDALGRHAAVISVLATGGGGKATLGLTAPSCLRAERVDLAELPASLRVHLQSLEGGDGK